MTYLLLLAAMFTQVNDPTLTNYDFLRISRPFELLDEVRDNEFIHREKLAAAEEEAKEYLGREVTLDVVVKSVRTDGVSVTFFHNVDLKRRLPHAWLVNDFDKDLKSFLYGHESVIGRGHGKLVGYLKIGGPMPLDLAKTLRKGDHLAIHGNLRQVVAIKAEAFRDILTAQVVIEVSKIEKVESKIPTP